MTEKKNPIGGGHNHAEHPAEPHVLSFAPTHPDLEGYEHPAKRKKRLAQEKRDAAIEKRKTERGL